MFVTILFFLSAAEAAYSNINIIRLRSYVEEKRRGAKKAVYLAEKYELTLTAFLVMKVIIKITLVALVLFFMISLITKTFIAYIVAISIAIIVILLFGELFPKQWGRNHAERVALKLVCLSLLVYKIVYPLTYLFVRLKKAINKRYEKQTPSIKVTEEELESIIEAMETEGVIDEDDADLLQSAISLNETSVYDIMTPRVDVIAINIDDSVEDIKQVFFDYQFSRMPVYKEDKDNIIGILSERDFFTALLNKKIVNIKELLSSPYYVSETTKVNELIKEMQRQKRHFAIVSDEYGGTSGIVTMEDALEELVGEIYDEYDEEEEHLAIVELGDNNYLIPPDMDLEEMFDALKLGPIPESKYVTVGGFVYSLCEGLPVEGQVVNYNLTKDHQDEEERYLVHYKLDFLIKKVENRRIRSIELKLQENEE